MKVPAGYRAFPFPGGYAFAHGSLLGAVHRILADGDTLHDWAAGCREAESLGGRGAAYSVPAPAPGPDGRARWVVRRYRRGGAVRWLGGWYRRSGQARPVLELHASVEARQRGVPTPAVTAGAFYPVGAAYRADIATELVPDASSLAARLFPDRGRAKDGAESAGRPDALSAPGPSEAPTAADRSEAPRADLSEAPTASRSGAASARARSEALLSAGRAEALSAAGRSAALSAAGRLTRLLEDAGVVHADLNAHNVVLRDDADGPEAHVVDLDRCRILPPGAPPPRGAMRSRLERSLRKLGDSNGPPLTDGEWRALRTGYEPRG